MERAGSSQIKPLTVNSRADPIDTIDTAVRDTSPDRHAFLLFATRDELPLAPGLLAMGPSGVSLRLGFEPSDPDIRFDLNGSLRALADPDGVGWVVNRPFQLVFDPELMSIGPITFASRTLLADLGLVRVHAMAGASIGPSFTGSGFELVADQLGVEFFQSGEFITASASLQANGAFTLTSTLPVNGAGAGVVRLRPVADRTSRVAANPLAGTLAVSFPEVFVNSDIGLWDDNLFRSPAFTFDSENFSFRVPLPSVHLQFADLPLQGNNRVDDRNFLEFTRINGATRVKLRNRQELFLGRLKMALDMSSGGSLSGSLSGTLGVEGPEPLNHVSDRVSMTYQSSSSPEFILNRVFLGVPCRVKLGSGLAVGGEACLLELSNEPLSQRAEFFCLP